MTVYSNTHISSTNFSGSGSNLIIGTIPNNNDVNKDVVVFDNNTKRALLFL